MVRKNIYDSVLEGIIQVIDEVSEGIGGEFKGANPFDKEPVDKKQALFNWSQTPPEVQLNLRQTLGEGAIEEYLRKIGGGDGSGNI